jgi:hypothetical protein
MLINLACITHHPRIDQSVLELGRSYFIFFISSLVAFNDVP